LFSSAECQTGSLDLGAAGDGRWRGHWYPVQCDVAKTSLAYSFQGSNYYYVKLAVVNTRVPVASVLIYQNGNAVVMTPTSDNYWVLFSVVPIVFPFAVTVTSVLGHSVNDTVPLASPAAGTPRSGSAQLPLSPQYAVAGNAASPVVGNAAQAAPASPPMLSAQAALPPAPSFAGCRLGVQPYSQCGGRGGVCQGAQCADKRWPGACCSSGYNCVRASEWYYQCVRQVTSASAQAATGDVVVPDYSQCGGTAACPDSKLCRDGPWVGYVCTSGFQCARWDQHTWTCRELPAVVTYNATKTESAGPPVTLNQASYCAA